MRFRQIGTERYRVIDSVHRSIGEVWYDRTGRSRTWRQSLQINERHRTRGEAASALLSTFNSIHGGSSVATPAAPRHRAAVTARRDRAFGIEMELTGPSAGAIIGALRAAGISVVDTHTSYHHSNGITSWELKHDSSVAGAGLELVSPKLYGNAGFTELKTVCTALNSVQATVNRSCGLHVHHDMEGRTVDQIKRQVLMFLNRQHLIAHMVAPSRRTNHYSAPWSITQVQQLEAFSLNSARTLRDISYIGPRGAINLQAYAAHGSVEIRFHNGTTSFKKIAAWVRFGQALFAAAEAQADVSTTDLRQMLNGLLIFGLRHEDLAPLLRFQEQMDAAEERVEAQDYRRDASEYAEVTR